MSTTTHGPTAQGAPREPLSDDALETSKLLVELLQEGTPGRRNQTRGPAAGSLSPHAIRAAIHVYQHGTVTIGQLGDGLGISQGWASRLVDDMVRSGHLVRERDPDDRRVYRVRLSPIAVEIGRACVPLARRRGRGCASGPEPRAARRSPTLSASLHRPPRQRGLTARVTRTTPVMGRVGAR